MEAPFTQCREDGQPRGDFLRGNVAQRRNFEHDFFRVDQFQVPAGQAFVCAVDENQLLAHQFFGACMGERSKHQRHIGGRRVCGAGTRAIEQLVANDGLLCVDDGLAGNECHGRLVDVLGGRGRDGDKDVGGRL